MCAAMDRQHPRDLYDVKMLLNNEGITRNIFVGFLVYMLGHPRPMNEVLSPNWKDISQVYANEFVGMTNEAIGIEELEVTRNEMLEALKANFTKQDCDFLLSFKRANPDWSLFDIPSAQELPAIKWKLINLVQLKKNEDKHLQQLNKLDAVLQTWL